MVSARKAPTKKNGHHQSSTYLNPAAASHIAGPGQSPPIPQPTPKMAPPRINSTSIDLFVGMLNFPVECLSTTGHSSCFFGNYIIRYKKTMSVLSVGRTLENSEREDITYTRNKIVAFDGLVAEQTDKESPA
jgi:hypothetical protein